MTDEPDSQGGSRVSMRHILYGGLGVLLLFGMWFTRPWWHWLWYSLFHRYPGIVQWFLIGSLLVLIGGYFYLRDAEETEPNSRRSYGGPGLLGHTWKWVTNSKGQLLVGLGLSLIILSIPLGLGIGGVYANVDMAERVNSSAERVDGLPNTDADNPRILPQSVADEYADNQFQYQRHRLGPADITYVNGTPHWTYGIEPEGWNRYTINQEGAVYVDMTTRQSSVSVQETSFSRGQNMVAWRGHNWQVYKDDYWIEQKDTMVVPTEDEQYLVVPYREHDHQLRFTPIPQVYSVPEFGARKSGLLHQISVALGFSEEGERYGGVKIIDSDGNIETVDAGEIDDHPILQDQRVYPYEQTRYEVESMAYIHGAVNTWFWHEDQLEVNDPPGDANSQPFTVTTEDGPAYIVAAEPAETGSGVYQIWVADGRTGDLSVMELDRPETGPAASVEYVMTEIDRAGLSPVEPVPVIVNDQLYWQVKVVPDDGRGIRATAFVNAQTTDVTMVETDEDVRVFISGDQTDVDEADLNGEGSDGDDSTPPPVTGDGLTITIEHPDGTTEEITVDEGSSVTIESRSSDDE